MRKARTNHASAALNGEIYAIGGKAPAPGPPAPSSPLPAPLRPGSLRTPHPGHLLPGRPEPRPGHEPR